MVACFFGKTLPVTIVPLVRCRTVSSEWYTTNCLSGVFEKISKTNRQRRIILQHDNASSDTSAQTVDFLSTQKIGCTFPSYSKQNIVRTSKRSDYVHILSKISNFTIETSVARRQHWGCRIPKHKRQPTTTTENNPTSTKLVLQLVHNCIQSN